MSYQAARRTIAVLCVVCRCAKCVTSKKRPNSAGAVLRIGKSDQCLCVSKPRAWRTSWNVVCICQRLMNRAMIRSGSASRSVHKRAWISNSS